VLSGSVLGVSLPEDSSAEEVARAKANATAINLIIVFSSLPRVGGDAQPLRAAGRLSAFRARAGREKTGRAMMGDISR
jgi:hypothetical protein